MGRKTYAFYAEDTSQFSVQLLARPPYALNSAAIRLKNSEQHTNVLVPKIRDALAAIRWILPFARLGEGFHAVAH